MGLAVSKKDRPSSAFAVIQRDRTRIWDGDFDKNTHPFVIYNHDAIPRVKRVAGVKSTSNYDVSDAAPGVRSSFKLFTSWFTSGLNSHYCERISEHLKDYENIYLLGEKNGLHNTISDYLDYATLNFPQIPVRTKDSISLRAKKTTDKEALHIAKDLISV